MKFVHKKYLIGNSKEIEALQKAASRLYKKMLSIAIQNLDISTYSKVYLKKHQSNLTFLFQMYTFLIIHLQMRVQKPLKQITVVDHGGGIGILSLLCNEVGMKVLYNDIYGQVVKDAKIISNTLGVNYEYYHHGSLKGLAEMCVAKNIEVDGIISSEVIEHIYNIESFLNDLRLFPTEKLHFVFSTSANSKNPLRNRKLMKMQISAELVGNKAISGWKEKDSTSPFIEIREKILSEIASELETHEINKLASLTRGMRKEAIVKAVFDYKSGGILPQELKHKTNTCDPNTGNWTEHLMDPKLLQHFLLNQEIKSEIIPGFYSVGDDNWLLISVKRILNILIKLVGKKGVYLSHYWILASKLD